MSRTRSAMPLASQVERFGSWFACGSNSTSEPAEPVALDMAMTDAVTFEPSEITVAQGAEITITATNEALLTKHNLIILGDVFDGLGEIRGPWKTIPELSWLR